MSPWTFFFDDAEKKSRIIFTEPVAQVVALRLADVIPALKRLADFRQQGFYAAGFIAYEAGFAFYPSSSYEIRGPDQPLVSFGIFEEKKTESFTSAIPHRTPVLFDFHWDTSFEDYKIQQQKIHEALLAGDIYQLNQTLQLNFKTDGRSEELYQSLRDRQSTAYSAHLKFPNFEVLSLSPELFYKKTGARLVTQPMKGTLAKGLPAEDLTQDPKSIAENLMIVDLLRNDLGRMAKPGSVHVEQLFEIQQLKTVQQMTSTISCEVDPEVSVSTILSCLFPCGSITGAPKWSAMQRISLWENSPRGLYTGAIGFIEPNNDQCFNVAIRTLVLKNQHCTLGVGGGIVTDSDVQSEYKEAFLKSQFVRSLNDQFYLFETMAVVDQKIRFLDLHLQRLQRSATFYGFPVDVEMIGQRLSETLVQDPQKQVIQLRLFWNGEIQITKRPFPGDDFPKRIQISPLQVDSTQHFQFHKTSRRDVYDQEWARAQKENIYDFIFLNEKLELVEATRHNLFLKVDGHWKTPPITSGALPGVQRQITIKDLQAQEASLTVEDLSRAEEILLTNSVRGQVQVKWMGL